MFWRLSNNQTEKDFNWKYRFTREWMPFSCKNESLKLRKQSKASVLKQQTFEKEIYLSAYSSCCHLHTENYVNLN